MNYNAKILKIIKAQENDIQYTYKEGCHLKENTDESKDKDSEK